MRALRAPIIQGDLAAITTTGKIFPLSALTLGSAPEYEQRLAADGFPLPSATEARDSALAIHEGKQEAQGERQQAWEARQIEWAVPGPGGLTPADVATEPWSRLATARYARHRTGRRYSSRRSRA